MMKTGIFRELTLIFSVFALIFGGFLFFTDNNSTLDINIYDTYFTVLFWPTLIASFLVISFMIWFTRVVIQKLQDFETLLFFSFIVAGLLFMLDFFKLLYELVKLAAPGRTNISSNGWTIYPPLSAIKPEQWLTDFPPTNSGEFFWIKLVLIIIFGLTAFKLGILVKNKDYE